MIIVLAGVAGSGKDTIGDILAKNHGFVKEAFANPLKAMVKHAFPAFADEDLYGPSARRETQYSQYPFSGMCLKCCRMCTFDPLDGSEEQAPDKSKWYCPRCDALYPKYMTPRLALQTLGTEWGRRLYSDIWIDAAFERIKNYARPFYDTLGKHMIDPTTGQPATLEAVAYKANWVITDCRFFNEVVGSQRNGGIVVKLRRGERASTSTHASEAEFRTIPDRKFDYVFDNDLIGLDSLPREVEHMLKCLENYTRTP